MFEAQNDNTAVFDPRAIVRPACQTRVTNLRVFKTSDDTKHASAVQNVRGTLAHFAAYPAVQGISLSIAKPQALAGQAESGGVRLVRERPPESPRQSTPFGFIESQLETSEASISIVGLNAGASLTPALLGAEQALLLPLTGKLEGPRRIATHEPARLASAEACSNHDAVAATLVVCAQRSSHA